MSERSPRLRGLRLRGSQRSAQPREDNRNENPEKNEENKAGDEQDQESSEAPSDDDLHIVIKDEQEEGVADERSEGDKNYECKSCKPVVVFDTLAKYLQHLKDEHKEKSLSVECPHCDFVAKDAKTLEAHLGKEHKNLGVVKAPEEITVNKCTMCPHVAINATELEYHQRVHHLKRRFFRCTKCSYVTHVRARYTKHVKYHSMPMIKCDDCDFRTPYKWNLDRHTRNHGGAGAFQCRACSFTADIRQSLTVHETNHHEPPVGQHARRFNSPFERKSRNGPKRYNQVGASDFRDNNQPETPKIVKNASPSKLPSSEVNAMEERRSAIAGAECIALKCEEKGCQFITAWDSEMQRHLAESHAPAPMSPTKLRKPLPMLIPLSPAEEDAAKKKKAASSNGSPPKTLLKVPRVRVRPELARIARDTEIAKLYGNREPGRAKKEAISAEAFKEKNASFFDKLKERLMTTNASKAAAVIAPSDLKCWCTFEASSPSELANHSQTHRTALSVSTSPPTPGSVACPKCKARFSNSYELQAHESACPATTISNDPIKHENSFEENPDNYEHSFESAANYCYDDFEFPFQADWDGNYGGLNSSGSSVESNAIGRRVFKCPHCPFWASTASRFHVHIVGHLNRKPFECSLCAYRSNWRWDITKHIKLKAARDPAHITARVLMTDETGRRNYSKYNKYLAQGNEETALEECQEGEPQIDEPPKKKKVVIMSKDNKEFPGPPELTPAPAVVENSETNSMSILTALNLRPPPLLKSAARSHGQSLLKTNPSTAGNSSANAATPASNALPSATSQDESKRTLWKCKRCNFRSSSKETVLSHVKTHYEAGAEQTSTENEKDEYTCPDCPFVSTDATAMAIHRIHHRPNLEAIFKCYLCPYYVTTKKELLDHAMLHGEELAVVHQRSVNSVATGSKRKLPQTQTSSSETPSKPEVEIEPIIEVSPSDPKPAAGPSEETNAAPPLLLDTRALPDTPLVWVSRPDGTIAKMLKCRHCPYVSLRRAEVRDHETMHVNNCPTSGPLLACGDCSFTCSRRDVMDAHTDMHMGGLGTVHCLVDETRTDPQQLEDLATLLGLERVPAALGTEPDLRDSRLVHCCSKCPARFLCEKELRIHLRYHSTELAYSCEWCSYAARQPAHLLAHQKAHSTEYQERTRHLLTMYGHSQRYAPPSTARVESTKRGVSCWIVVEISQKSGPVAYSTEANSSSDPRNVAGQVFTCAKCPARYFKLDALEYHMTLHGSNNRFRCAECDYSSKTSQNLVKHQVVHRRSVPSAMEQEIPSLAQPPQPQSPKKPEPVDPQFGASIKGNPNFVYPGCLRNGRIKEKRYKCHKCPSAFEKREQYRVHLTLHGAKQRFRCDKCDYSVKYYANYAQHVKKHQANAQAQAVKRQHETEATGAVDDVVEEAPSPENRASETCRKSTISTLNPAISAGNGLPGPSVAVLQPSNQDKQSMLLMQRKLNGSAGNAEEKKDTGRLIRCQECPYSGHDVTLMDSHKRRHGIERLTPPCPHCNYVPRNYENIGEHIRLHFTRLYKPEAYLIVELLSLTVRPLVPDDKEAKNHEPDVLFRECEDGKFLPVADHHSVAGSAGVNGYQEKVIVDPNTGETQHPYSA